MNIFHFNVKNGKEIYLYLPSFPSGLAHQGVLRILVDLEVPADQVDLVDQVVLIDLQAITFDSICIHCLRIATFSHRKYEAIMLKYFLKIYSPGTPLKPLGPGGPCEPGCPGVPGKPLGP